ncbi:MULTISPECIES: hypothetical protein [Aerosakkonema]|uniref:hypothetical protein n=1 Tax=Aerosakkonema TaxID=1246629 RepID=UPI0035B89912
MAIIELIFLLTLAGMPVLLILRTVATSHKQQQLQNAFYQLLKEQNSRISLIQLAATAKVEPQLAQQYLEQQINTFGAVPEVDADGDIFYRFPKL